MKKYLGEFHAKIGIGPFLFQIPYCIYTYYEKSKFSVFHENQEIAEYVYIHAICVFWGTGNPREGAKRRMCLYSNWFCDFWEMLENHLMFIYIHIMQFPNSCEDKNPWKSHESVYIYVLWKIQVFSFHKKTRNVIHGQGHGEPYCDRF